jgi:hypothetical protein
VDSAIDRGHGVRPLLGRDRADGTVVGCWSMRHGLDGGDVIAKRSRRSVATCSTRAGRLPDVRAAWMVRAWKRGRRALVAAVLPHAWRRESAWHGELHWRCVAATGLTRLGGPDVDRALVPASAFHDTRRINEAVDPRVARGGVRAGACADGLLQLDEPRFATRRGAAAPLGRTGLVRPDDRHPRDATPAPRAFRSCRIRAPSDTPPGEYAAVGSGDACTHGPPVDALSPSSPLARGAGEAPRRARIDPGACPRTSQSRHEVGTDT